MRNSFLRAIATSCTKNNIQCALLNSNFIIFKKKTKPMLFRFLTATLSPLELAFFNSMLALLPI
jgi:hypothetical protein